MTMDEFEMGWREMDPEGDMEVIFGTFQQFDAD